MVKGAHHTSTSGPKYASGPGMEEGQPQLQDTSHRRRAVCPHIGCYWDRTTRSLEPDPDNRCYAKPAPGLLARLLGGQRHFQRVDVTDQRKICYGEYLQCPSFRALQIKSAPDHGGEA